MVDYAKPWLPVDDQIDKLVARGVTIADRVAAAKLLRTFSRSASDRSAVSACHEAEREGERATSHQPPSWQKAKCLNTEYECDNT